MSPPSFLKVFPREIRDLIYTFILASPDGSITLSPWSVDVAKSLLILRTCKQIHREVKDIIWEHKKLALRNDIQLSDELEGICWTHERTGDSWSLIINLEILDWDELEWISRSFERIMKSKTGNHPLHITIKTSKERPKTMIEFQHELDLREDGRIVDGRLFMKYNERQFNKKKDVGYGKRNFYKVNVVFNTAWPRLSPWWKKKWLAEMLLDPRNTNELVCNIYRMFQGKLYIDGNLCFEDNKQIMSDFKVDPRDGKIEIYPHNPLKSWRINLSGSRDTRDMHTSTSATARQLQK